MSARRSIGIKRRGCESCRVAHSKCDRRQPKCGRCARLGKDCQREPAFRFMNSRESEIDVGQQPPEQPYPAFEYSEAQIWIQTPATLEFVHHASQDSQDQIEAAVDATPDERTLDASPPSRGAEVDIQTPQLTEQGHSHIQPSPASSPSSPVLTAQDDHAPSNPDVSVHELPDVASTAPASSPSLNVLSDHPSGTTESLDVESARHRHGWLQQGHHRNSPLLAPEYRGSESLHGHSPWRLTEPHGPMLMRYFVTDLSKFFDYCDPERSFSTAVVQEAVNCPTLLLAILAVSSRHLSLSSDFDSYIADQYHRDCLALLIPMLNDRSTLLDEGVCAATVILRLYEELSVTIFGEDTRSHILGTHIFAVGREYRSTGILQAALRVALRQEINVAFFTRKPIQLLSAYFRVNDDSSAADQGSDWSWTLRIIVLCADVLNHCYCNPAGDEQEPSQPWAELAKRAETWLRHKPASFEPLRCRERDPGCGRAFPEVWLLNDCHVAGHIYYLMCHILLTAYDPRRPRLGPGRGEASRETNEIIREDVRSICAIALSNPHAQPSLFKACTVISLCGDLFTDRAEQQSLIDVLIKTEADLAWPTATSQEYLKQGWGWTE